MTKTNIDSLSKKISIISKTIISLSLFLGFAYLSFSFIIGNLSINNILVRDEAIIYFLFIGSSLGSVFVAKKIQDTLLAKILYGILTFIISLICLGMAIVIPTLFLFGLM